MATSRAAIERALKAALQDVTVAGDQVYFPASWAGYTDAGTASTSLPLRLHVASAQCHRLMVEADRVLAEYGVDGTVYRIDEGRMSQGAIVERLLFDIQAAEARRQAAATLGRKGGLAGKGSPARAEAARKAIRTRWDREKHISVTAIDTGFDVRSLEMAIRIPRGITSVTYDDPKTGTPQTVRGTLPEIADVLREAGYTVELPESK